MFISRINAKSDTLYIQREMTNTLAQVRFFRATVQLNSFPTVVPSADNF